MAIKRWIAPRIHGLGAGPKEGQIVVVLYSDHIAACEALAKALEKAVPVLESELESILSGGCIQSSGGTWDRSSLESPAKEYADECETALNDARAALSAYREGQ